MASNRYDVLFPGGRFIAGNLYKANDKDYEGKPRVFRQGHPKAGQPDPRFQFGVAIPKAGEQHWSQTAWGQIIWRAGHEGTPNANVLPDFAWKVDDGDDARPNKRRKIPRDREGFAGHWVVWYSSSIAPKIYQIPAGSKDPVVFEQVDAIRPGDYVEVYGSVTHNGNVSNPGVFVNGGMVCLLGYGTRITTSPDVSQAGFGRSAPMGTNVPPAGHTAMPVPGAPAAAVPPAYTPPAPGAAAAPPAYQAPAASAPPAAPGVAVAPNTSFAPPPPVTAAPPAAGIVMLDGSDPGPWRQAGWSDDQLVQHGKARRA